MFYSFMSPQTVNKVGHSVTIITRIIQILSALYLTIFVFFQESETLKMCTIYLIFHHNSISHYVVSFQESENLKYF